MNICDMETRENIDCHQSIDWPLHSDKLSVPPQLVYRLRSHRFHVLWHKTQNQQQISFNNVSDFFYTSVKTRLPLEILARQVVFPEQNLPRTQAFNLKGGMAGEEGAVGWWLIFLSRCTTYPRMLLLFKEGGASPASSGHAHSPSMFWKIQHAHNRSLQEWGSSQLQKTRCVTNSDWDCDGKISVCYIINF